MPDGFPCFPQRNAGKIILFTKNGAGPAPFFDSVKSSFPSLAKQPVLSAGQRFRTPVSPAANIMAAGRLPRRPDKGKGSHKPRRAQ